MITQDKLIGNSLIQNAYDYFNECLESFAKEQPSFKYTISFGTNSMDDYAEDSDTFNFVFYNDSPELIPSHWSSIDGETELLQAGYLNIGVAFLNPIPLDYNDDFTIETTEQSQYTSSTYSQEQFNEVSDEDNNKIEYGIRLLEAFALFMRRKGVKVGNYNFTSNCNRPMVDGLFENGFYRLSGVLNIQLKFNLLNKLGSSLINGEETRVWVKFGNQEYEEIYNILEYQPIFNVVEKTYPVFNKTTTRTTSNQISRTTTLDCPYINYGGCKKIVDVFESGNLDLINNMSVRVFDGNTYKEYNAVITSLNMPYSIDRFNGIHLSMAITSDVKTVEI